MVFARVITVCAIVHVELKFIFARIVSVWKSKGAIGAHFSLHLCFVWSDYSCGMGTIVTVLLL